MKKITIFKILTMLFFMIYGAETMAKHKIVAANFDAPTGIAFDDTGEMFVTNWSGQSIVKIAPDGQREIFYSGISSPSGIVIDRDHNLYVSSYSDNYILRIDQMGKSKIIARDFHTPTGIAFTQSGELLITNRSTGEIVALDVNTGSKKVLAAGLTTPVGVTELPNGSLVVSQYSGRLTLIRKDGSQTELGADFIRPGVGIVTVADDIVAVIDNGAGAVRAVNVQTGKSTLLADGLPGAVALAFNNGNYYVGTWDDNSVHSINE